MARSRRQSNESPSPERWDEIWRWAARRQRQLAELRAEVDTVSEGIQQVEDAAEAPILLQAFRQELVSLKDEVQVLRKANALLSGLHGEEKRRAAQRVAAKQLQQEAAKLVSSRATLEKGEKRAGLVQRCLEEVHARLDSAKMGKIQAENEINQLTPAFAELGRHLEIADADRRWLQGELDKLRQASGGIRAEIVHLREVRNAVNAMPPEDSKESRMSVGRGGLERFATLQRRLATAAPQLMPLCTRARSSMEELLECCERLEERQKRLQQVAPLGNAPEVRDGISHASKGSGAMEQRRKGSLPRSRSAETVGARSAATVPGLPCRACPTPRSARQEQSVVGSGAGNYEFLLICFTLSELSGLQKGPQNLVFPAATSTAQAALPMDGRPSIKEALQGIKEANWRKALEWLQRAPDAVVICNACANSCSKAHHWQMALTLTSQVTLKRLEATEVTCNTAIQAVVRGGRWHQALELASVAFSQVRRDAVTWNSAADAVSRRTDGVWPLSLELLSLEPLGLEPDVITESLRAAALKAANSQGHSAVWRNALEFAGRSLLVTTSALGALSSAQWCHALQMLSVSGALDAQALSVASKLCQESWHWALHLLEEVNRPDAVAISSAMTALSLALNWERALTLFHRLPARNRDVVSYGAAMTAAAAGKHWELALFWLYEMAYLSVTPNLITYNAAINACEEGLQWDRALALLQIMARSKVTADVISYSSCIAACGQGQRWTDAMELLHEMRERQLQRNIIALSSAVSVCEKAGRWALALDLLQLAWQLKLEVNTVTYNAAISACEKCSQWEMALKIFDDMGLLRISRSMITSAAIITACAQAASWVHATKLLELQSKASTQQAGARFAALAATCAACEGGGAVATMPKMLKEMSESTEVLAVELLDNHGLLCSAAAARLKRKIWHPMVFRCSALTRGSGGTGSWRLYDPILEQESFLSTVFTMDMLHQLNLDIPNHRCWLPEARHRSRFNGSNDPTPREPNAKGIAAWTAGRMGRRRDAADTVVICSGRVHEWSWQWGSADLLVPIFVEHDRSPHAERQALLTWIHQVQSSKGKVLQ
eukprot:s497_g18.t1